MADGSLDEQYFTYEARLASFQKSTKKRKSTASGRGGKALNWPHKQITPASLAKAGFFFNPAPENPDNATCFLCHKGLDGWEEDDDPLVEHITHAPSCGWAIVASIEAEVGDHGKEDPSLPHMIAARKATFAGRWPHEGKRGWKCKTKQLVDAGWKYTPSPESDDKTTCAYCQLALDAWEQNDKPLDEHYKRAPSCPFFSLNKTQTKPKRATRGKANRGSKTSRASIQSVATTISESASIADMTTAIDDTMLTTTSTMSKKSRGKKTAAPKGRKAKAKKEGPVEPEPELEQEEPGLQPEPQEAPAMQEEEDETPRSPPKKATRGKKRGSEAVEESTVTMIEAPAPKKRATRGTRASSNVANATLEPSVDLDMIDAPAPAAKRAPGRPKGRTSKAKSSRKLSNTSTVSLSSMALVNDFPEEFPDDDEIERQLEADLQRPLTDDEVDVDSDSERSRTKAKARRNSMNETAEPEQAPEYAMFDPAPIEPDEAAVQVELEALEAEMRVNEPDKLHVPKKKGRKPGPRNVSKQTQAKKAKAATPPPPVVEAEAVEEDEIQEASVGSTDTVIKTKEQTSPPVKRGRGRPPKASVSSQNSTTFVDVVETVAAPAEEKEKEKRRPGRPSKVSLSSQVSKDVGASQNTEPPAKRGRGRPKKSKAPATMATENEPQMAIKVDTDDDVDELADSEPVPAPKRAVRAISKPMARPSAAIQIAADSPSTPAKAFSPASSARQPALSPSQSPQSSDAENQPPSSVPAASATAKRIALATLAETPVRNSPSKRNVVAGLQSTTPWTAMDLDAVLGSPRNAADKENAAGRLLRQGKELTTPEKGMTVEEWIYFNAGEAESMLKHECEAMVSRFESQGTKAMNVLEGLMVE